MAAIIYRLRCVLRTRWVSVVIVTATVGIVSAVVVAVAAGAHRTATAPDRYTSSSGTSFDGLVTQEHGGPPRTRELAALSTVESASSFTFVFGGLVDPTAGDPLDALVFSGSYDPLAVQLVSGRDANSTVEHEFVATRSFVDLAGAELGDVFDLVTLTQEQADAEGFLVSDPQGPQLTIELVGIVDGPVQLDDPTPIAMVSPALLDRPDLGIALTMVAVDLRPEFDLSELRSELEGLPDSVGLQLEPGRPISDDVRRAVQIQARGLWLLAGATGLAAVIVLGQLITRQVRPTPSERQRLTAIGFTRAQVVGVAAAHALVPIVVGSFLGAGLAIIPSSAFPFGFVRVVEPDPGTRVDAGVLSGTAVTIIVVLSLWVIASLTMTPSTGRSIHPSPLVEALATRTAGATAATGVRCAFTRSDRDRGSVPGTLVGLALTVAMVVGAATFGTSLARLVREPFRYGTNYDVALGDNGGRGLPPEMLDRLDADPDVTSLMVYTITNARIGDTVVPMLGMDVIRGDGTPTLIDGRLPAGADEIVLGRATARDVDAAVGDDVTLAGRTGTHEFRVTGLVVMPGFGSTDGMGDGGLVTETALAQIDDIAQPTIAATRLGIEQAPVIASLVGATASEPVEPFVPSAIVNIERVRFIPFALAGVLAVLMSLTLGHVMMTSVLNRRRDHAVFRSLGAGRRWVALVVHWHATAFTMLAVVLGIPVGVVAGRLIFNVFARNMGVVDDAAIPAATISVGSILLVGLANVVASISVRQAARIGPAQLLRAE
jgi:hypothetical protein